MFIFSPKIKSVTDSVHMDPTAIIGYHRNTCVFVRKGNAENIKKSIERGLLGTDKSVTQCMKVSDIIAS